MAYLNKRDMELLKAVNELLFLQADKDLLTENEIKTTMLFGNWLLNQRDYGKKSRELAKERIKTKRKTDPKYCRMPADRQRVYQKKYREKKKKEAIENVIQS